MSDNAKKYLIYTGIYGSIISAIAYLIITYVLVMGFESAMDRDKQILFSVLSAIVGLVIAFLLRSQGMTFGAQEDRSKEVMAEYHRVINKTKSIKKMRRIGHYMFWQTVKDIFVKGVGIAISSFLLLYIFMEGNGSFGLFLLAISNILMFAGFGLVALSKTYDKYTEEHIPVVIEITRRLKDEKETEQMMKELFTWNEINEFPAVIGTGFEPIPYKTIDQVGSVRPEEQTHANLQQRGIPDTASAGPEEQGRHLGQQNRIRLQST